MSTLWMMVEIYRGFAVNWRLSASFSLGRIGVNLWDICW